MANPQLENGHTQIANEILDNLVRIHLSSNQWQVLFCIIRKTYGFHKKVDYIANSQIVEATGLCKAVVSRCLATLQEWNIIIRKGKDIGFQKNWEDWHNSVKISSGAAYNTGAEKLAVLLTKVSNSVNSEKLAEQSTPDIKVSNIANTDISLSKLAIQSTELAEQSTKVSSPAVAQKIKDTIQKKDIYIRVFEHWNSLHIIEHKKLTDSMKRKFETALKNYSEDDIKLAISNYAECRKENPKVYLWTLEEFCQRSIEKFLDIEVAKQKYEFLKPVEVEVKSNDWDD